MPKHVGTRKQRLKEGPARRTIAQFTVALAHPPVVFQFASWILGGSGRAADTAKSNAVPLGSRVSRIMNVKAVAILNRAWQVLADS